MPVTKNQQNVEQILLGLAETFPQELLIPKLRYFLEKLSDESYAQEQLVPDLFEVLKETGEYPTLTVLSQFVEARDPQEVLLNFFKLMEHLSHSSMWKNLKILIKFFDLPNKNKESCHNSIILMLEEQSNETGSEYCHYLREILLEEDAYVKLNKILDYFIYLYECPKILQLKKAIEHYLKLDSDLQIWKFLSECIEQPLVERLKSVRAMYPEYPLHVAFSKSQILSKEWACYEISQLNKPNTVKSALVLCGWLGVLPALMFKKMGDDAFDRVRSVDIDESCLAFSDLLNRYQKNNDAKFKAVTSDIYKLNYERTQLPISWGNKEAYIEETIFDFIINTSCEHLEKFDEWYSLIPKGKLILLQSNDFFDCEEHVNCKKSLREFKNSAPMNEYLYEGELKLEKYTRFMLIGIK